MGGGGRRERGRKVGREGEKGERGEGGGRKEVMGSAIPTDAFGGRGSHNYYSWKQLLN